MEGDEGKLLNLTPHDITVVDPTCDNEPIIVVHPHQTEAMRLDQTNSSHCPPYVTSHKTVIRTVYPPKYTGVNFMPPKGSSIIVSTLVAEYFVKHFPDHCANVFAPDTSPAGGVRDEKGRPIGTIRLVRYK